MTEFDTQKRILDLPCPCAADTLNRAVEVLAARYPKLGRAVLGHSILDREIPLLQLGTGAPAVVWVGAQSGTDTESAAVLTRFVNEYCEQQTRQGRIFGHNLSYLAELRRVDVVPMLNPDGVGYATAGVAEDHLLHSRLLAMNGGRDDFSAWQANARGVDLRCNYAADFVQRRQAAMADDLPCGGPAGWCGEAPESEPESAALCRWLRVRGDIGLLLELRSGKRRLVQPRETDRRTAALGRTLARLGSMQVTTSDGSELCDWAAGELGIPSFVVYCGESGTVFDRYAVVREMLFVAPTLVGR